MRRRSRDQAHEVGRGWSGPDAEPGWALVGALFDALAADADLLALAAEIPLDRLPALLFVASVQRVVADHPDEPLARYYPGPAQRPIDDAFAGALRRLRRHPRRRAARVVRPPLPDERGRAVHPDGAGARRRAAAGPRASSSAWWTSAPDRASGCASTATTSTSATAGRSGPPDSPVRLHVDRRRHPAAATGTACRRRPPRHRRRADRPRRPGRPRLARRVHAADERRRGTASPPRSRSPAPPG